MNKPALDRPAKDRPKWTLEQALPVVRYLEEKLAPNYHCALTGSVLFQGTSFNDLDVIIFPKISLHFDREEIRRCLRSADLYPLFSREEVLSGWKKSGSLDQKWVEVWRFGLYHRIDIFIMK